MGLPSPATLLLNDPVRGIMPIINRALIGINNDDEHYRALVKRQMKNDKNHDPPRNYASIPTVSTIEVQCKDGGPWNHETIERKGNHNHINISYTIGVTKMGQLITRNNKHVKPKQITAKQHLQDQTDKHIVTVPFEDFLKEQEKQTQTSHIYTQNEQLEC